MAGQLGVEIQDRGVTIGISFFTVTVDPPSIAANTAVNVDVAVVGVLIGDEVIAFPPATLEAGLSGMALAVVANASVRLRIANSTIAAIDGAALVWRLMIVTHR